MQLYTALNIYKSIPGNVAYLGLEALNFDTRLLSDTLSVGTNTKDTTSMEIL
jgi:hypothetical protein